MQRIVGSPSRHIQKYECKCSASLDVHLFTHLDLCSNNVFLSQHAALPIKNLLPRSVGGNRYRDPEDTLELGRPLNLQIQCTCRHR